MAYSVSSSGDKGGIQPQIVRSTGLENFFESELRLNLKLSPVTTPNQEGEQHSGQTIHFTVEHGTCQLILPQSQASDLLLNLKIPEALSLNFGQSSAPEPQTSTVQPPESLPGNLPLTDILLNIMKQNKKAIDDTKILLQNRSDRFAKVEKDLAMLKIAFFSSIGLEYNDSRDSGNVAEKEEVIQTEQQDKVGDVSHKSFIKEDSSSIADPHQVTVRLPIQNEGHEQCTTIAPKTSNLSKQKASTEDSTASGQNTFLNPELPSEHHPLLLVSSGGDKTKDQEETVLVPYSATDLPGTNDQTDEAAESEDPAPAPGRRQIISDPQPSTSQDTSENDIPFPSPDLAVTDKTELGKINVMMRKISIVLSATMRLRDICTSDFSKGFDKKTFFLGRVYGTEILDNFYKYACTDICQTSSKRKQQLQEFLGKKVTQFKKTDQLYIFYQALFELFRSSAENDIDDLSCFLESKKDKEGNLKVVEEKIIPELDTFVDKYFKNRINLYFDVQGRRYAGKPPQPDDEMVPDWRKNIKTEYVYQYILDSKSYNKQDLFHSAKRRHEENAWKNGWEGKYNLFYSFLSKNPKNMQMINSDFAFFANNEHIFTSIEKYYFSSILDVDLTNQK